LQQGDVARATRLYEELIEAVRQMSLPASELGRTIYQLACFYALTGQSTQAIEGLAEALQLEPRAFEWLRQDSDLDTLRTIPAFQELCAV
jgi:tetratricopeptide (TPR) repeat protein